MFPYERPFEEWWRTECGSAGGEPSNSTSPLQSPVSDIGRQLRRHRLQSIGSMNGGPAAPTARPRSGGSISTTAPALPTLSPRSSKGKPRTPKRRHDQTEAGSSSAESGEEAADCRGEKRRQPGVKRACNECRQQKVSHKALVLQALTDLS